LALYDIFVTDKLYVEDLKQISIYEFLPDFSLQLMCVHKTPCRLKYVDDRYIITGSHAQKTIYIYDTNFNLLKTITLDQNPYIICQVNKIVLYGCQKNLYAWLDNLEIKPLGNVLN
jgi:hypothetical protein